MLARVEVAVMRDAGADTVERWRTLRIGRPGPSGSMVLCGDRATALIEDFCREKIRGCSYTGGGASYSMSASPA